MLKLTAQYFAFIAQQEEKVEITKQILFEQDEFDPQDLYDYMKENQDELQINNIIKLSQLCSVSLEFRVPNMLPTEVGFQNSSKNFIHLQQTEVVQSPVDSEVDIKELKKIMKIQDQRVPYDSFLNFIIPSTRAALKQLNLNTYNDCTEPSSEIICTFLKIYQLELQYSGTLELLRQEIMDQCGGDIDKIYDSIDQEKEGSFDSINLKSFLESQGFAFTIEQVISIFRRLEKDTLTKNELGQIFSQKDPIGLPIKQQNLVLTPAAKNQRKYSSTQTKNNFDSTLKTQMSFFDSITLRHNSVDKVNKSENNEKLKYILEKKFAQVSKPNRAFKLRETFQKNKELFKKTGKVSINNSIFKDKTLFQQKNIDSSKSIKSLKLKEFQLSPQSNKKKINHLISTQDKFQKPFDKLQLNNTNDQLIDTVFIPCISITRQDIILSESKKHQNEPINQKIYQFDKDVDEFIVYLSNLLYQIQILRTMKNSGRYMNGIHKNDRIFIQIMMDLNFDQKCVENFYKFWNIETISQLFLPLDEYNTLTKKFIEQTLHSQDQNYKDKLKFFKNKKYSLIHLYEQIDFLKQGNISNENFTYILRRFKIPYEEEDLKTIMNKFTQYKSVFSFKEFLKELTP